MSLPELRHVNVRHLSEVMDSVFMLLGGIYSWLGEMEQNDSYYRDGAASSRLTSMARVLA